ncbi:MAG: hypothetical protein ACYDDO_11860 [Acidiferrobacterales bacterium]
MANTSLRLSDEHREQLQRLGLCVDQITALETVLPLNRALFKGPAPMADVRDVVTTLHKLVDQAGKATKKIVLGKEPSQVEARSRIEWANFDLKGDGALLAKATEVLSSLLTVVERVRLDLPKTQRRNVADFTLVARIDEALRRGFMKAHKSPYPPYTLHVTSSPNSEFRRIVGIYYEAITGISDIEPERAIKKYIAVCKKSNRVIVGVENSELRPDPKPRTKRRPRSNFGTAGGSKI